MDEQKQPNNENKPKIDEQELKNILKDVVLMMQDAKRERTQSQDEIEAMVSTCSEFMKSFIIIGYGFDGEPIPPVMYAKNTSDADALNTYINRFFMMHDMDM
jgi:hypothetical protein